MPDLQEDRSPVRVNDDGELIGGLFCVYCGEINEPGVDCCESCGQYIADQGPDLNARLRRENTHRMPCALRRDSGELTPCGETGA